MLEGGSEREREGGSVRGRECERLVDVRELRGCRYLIRGVLLPDAAVASGCRMRLQDAAWGVLLQDTAWEREWLRATEVPRKR